MRLKLLIVYALIFLNADILFAQNEQYRFSNLDISNGLSNNQVNCIYKDKRGFMWFGTMSGLNKYDGHAFKIFRHDANDPNSLNEDCVVNIYEGPYNKLWIETRNAFNIYDLLTQNFDHNIRQAEQLLNLPGGAISSIKKDSKGNYWFVFVNNGIYKYNPLTHQTQHFSHTLNGILYNDYITSISEDAQGNMWIVYHDGYLEKFSIALNKVIYRSDVLKKANGALNYTYLLTTDKDDDLWLYIKASTLGAFYFNPTKGIFRHLEKDAAIGKLNSNIINNIAQDNRGMVWIAADHGGINILDKRDFSVQYILNRENDAKSIAQNSGFVYKDNPGIMWYGTYKRGVSYYHENIIKFPLYRHFASDKNSLSYEDVNAFAEDAAGNLWIGTNGGGLIYFNRKTGKYTQYKHDPKNANTLANDVIVCLRTDHEKKLWIGTYFGGLDYFDGKTFIHYTHNERDSTGLSDDRVYAVFEDSANRLWAGVFTGGLNRFDATKKTFIHYKPFKTNSVHAAFISSIFEDKDKNIWFGSYYGVDELLNKNGRFIHYIHQAKNSNSLASNNIISITQDSRGLMWIGTLEGLDIFDPLKNKFSLLLKENGLPDNMVLNTLEDNDHNMWLSTPNGLCNMILTPGNNGYVYRFSNFDETDGLQGLEFNQNAALKTKNGELIFGGAKGFNMFYPKNISYNKSKPILALTDLQLFNKSLNPGDIINGRVILSKTITETAILRLNHNENAFSLQFADLNFLNPGKVKMEYKLEGFDKEWIKSDNTRKAIYTNIDPGDYTFKVREAGGDNLNGSMLTLPINIQPPFYKTGFAYLFYAIVFLSALYFTRKLGIKKIEATFALELERREAQSVHELDLMKIDFFTNVSHEFRTPLSLILAPVEGMIKESVEKDTQRKLQMVYQNSMRLLNMINQLMDFSKIAVKKVSLDLQEADIIKNISEACELFLTLADKKHIKFTFEFEPDCFVVFFDHDKMERILFNLVSNAIKFTPENGWVKVNIKVSESINTETVQLEMRVSDSGIGIPEDQHDKIFKRFFQNNMPLSVGNQGNGIGLSITKEFVNLMGGVISVESEPGKGSCFIVLLPFKVSKTVQVAVAKESNERLSVIKPKQPCTEKRNKKITVLVVEDNPDFRNCLKDDLSLCYHVVEAVNGREAGKKHWPYTPILF